MLWKGRTLVGVRGVFLRFATTTTNTKQLSETSLEDARPVTEIPGPRSYPLFGSILSLITDKSFKWTKFHKFWKSMVEKHGPILRFIAPGFPPMVALASPDDCERLYRMTMEHPVRPGMLSLKHIRDNWTEDYFEKRGGIITENGEEWWRVRSRVQTTMLKPMVMREYVPEIDEISLTFTDRIMELQEIYGEMPENFEEELYKWALESVGVVALDRRFGCIGAPAGTSDARQGQDLINAVNNIFACLAITELRLPLWRLFKTPSYKKLQENHAKLLRVVVELVGETVSFLEQRDSVGKVCKERRNSVIQTLLTTPGLTRKDIVTFIMDLIFTGIDTTTYTMAFCLYLLARNPEVQKKLQQEVDEVTYGLQGPLTSQHLARLSYMKAVIKETLRMYPILVGSYRVISKDVVMQGYRIPAGYMMLNLNSVMGCNSDLFPRADEFIPERWHRERPLGDIHPYASIPFGTGTRMCVGRRVAENEMYTLLTRVAQRFTVEYHHEDIEQLSGLILYPSRPLKFSFVSR